MGIPKRGSSLYLYSRLFCKLYKIRTRKQKSIINSLYTLLIYSFLMLSIIYLYSYSYPNKILRFNELLRFCIMVLSSIKKSEFDFINASFYYLCL